MKRFVAKSEGKASYHMQKTQRFVILFTHWCTSFQGMLLREKFWIKHIKKLIKVQHAFYLNPSRTFDVPEPCKKRKSFHIMQWNYKVLVIIALVYEQIKK